MASLAAGTVGGAAKLQSRSIVRVALTLVPCSPTATMLKHTGCFVLAPVLCSKNKNKHRSAITNNRS
jgi:hypothetical protein